MTDSGADFPEAKSVNLKNSIEYSPGAIVSKTLIKKDSGTITLFACDEGQKISEHSTPHDALVTILDGEALIIIGDEEIRVKEGESLLMPADIPHTLIAEKSYKKLLIMLED